MIFGILGLLGSAFLVFSPIAFLGSFGLALAQIIIGIICIFGSRFVSTLVWGIVLLVLGIIAGGIGGTLVVVGALIGIISALIRSPR